MNVKTKKKKYYLVEISVTYNSGFKIKETIRVLYSEKYSDIETAIIIHCYETYPKLGEIFISKIVLAEETIKHSACYKEHTNQNIMDTKIQEVRNNMPLSYDRW
jgi:hypothetical protein